MHRKTGERRVTGAELFDRGGGGRHRVGAGEEANAAALQIADDPELTREERRGRRGAGRRHRFRAGGLRRGEDDALL